MLQHNVLYTTLDIVQYTVLFTVPYTILFNDIKRGIEKNTVN